MFVCVRERERERERERMSIDFAVLVVCELLISCFFLNQKKKILFKY